MDAATGVISHIQADLADSRDCFHLPALVLRLLARLTAQELTLREFVADMGYSNGFNYAFPHQVANGSDIRQVLDQEQLEEDYRVERGATDRGGQGPHKAKIDALA